MSHHDNQNVQFEIAEVIEINNAFKWDKGIAAGANMFMCRARSCTTYTDTYNYDVVPISNRKSEIPVVGEIILICRTVNRALRRKKDKAESWYYIQTVDLQDGVNNNRSTGMTATAQEIAKNDPQYIPAGTNFVDTKISHLQPYEGDIIYQGRWGNSIRFGSTISTIPEDNYYHKSPTWSGDINGSPITILSNGRVNLDNKEFVVEDIEKDNSSLYLTSTQKINNITFSTIAPKQFNSFAGSNFIGIADRIVLRAKTDRAVIDSEKDILLNTPNRVNIGGDTNLTPIPQGDVLRDILMDIAQILQTGHIVQGSLATPVAQSKITGLLSKIFKMNSSNYSIKKNT
jgi:hypothetical protein